MNNQKNGCLTAFSLAVLVPIIFLIIFKYLDSNRQTIETDKCLPIYGNKLPNQFTNSKGKIVTDTIFHTIPDFSFVNHNGDTITQEIMKNKVVVADFFFTTCPSICIDMTSNLHKIQEEYFNDRDVIILSHTVDPETDSIGQLKKYAIEKDVNSKVWHLLTGNKKDLYAIARNGYLVTAVQGDGGPNDFIHSEKLVLIDKEKRIRGFYDGTNDAAIEQLKKDIQLLLVSYIVPMKDKK
jgi:protein SCO1/2